MNRDSLIVGNWETRTVCIDGEVLSPSKSQAIYNHSPDGFNWSYGGSGPSQLALGLLLTMTTKEEALKYYQDFKFIVVSSLPKGNFELKASEIYDWLDNRKNVKVKYEL